MVLLALAVAIPVLVAGFRVAASGWVPAIDDGTIATRSYDVFSSHPPLVGQYSLAGGAVADPAHSLGPMGYWLVAIPARFAPSWTIPIAVAAVNAVLLALVVGLARRRSGIGFAWVVAGALVLLVRAFGPVALAEIWNPWIALVPFTALVFVTWSVAVGDRWLLPAAVVLASFVIQAHLTYAVPAAGLLLVALIGGWGSERLGLSDAAAADAPAGGREEGHWLGRGGRWRPIVLSVGAGLLCWALPLYDQLTRNPGNLTLVARSSQTTGASGGLDAIRGSMWRTLGLPPRFARSEANPADEILHGLVAPGAVATALTMVVALILVAAAWRSVRRRDRSLVAGCAVVAVLLGGVLFVAANLPLSRAMVAGYSFRWFALAGLFAWLMVGLVVARETGLAARARGIGWLRSPVLAATGALALCVVGLTLPAPDSVAWSYRPAQQVSDLIESGTKPGGRYLIARTGRFDIAFTPALAWRLRTTGRNPIMRPPHTEAFGDAYRPSGQRCDALIALVPPSEPPVADAQVLGTVLLPGAPAQPPSMRLQLTPDTSRNGQC